MITKEEAKVRAAYLIQKLSTPEMRGMAEQALLNPAFLECCGSSDHHHNYPMGLVEHTLEVAELADAMAGRAINKDVLLMAAIWHDFCKINEYEWDTDQQKVKKTPYYQQIGHVYGSCEAFALTAMYQGMNPEFIEAVKHCILSHHGRKEWRSPVEPRTPEAWILHAADMMSAQGLERDNLHK